MNADPSIRFLTLEQVLSIHRRMIERYGGDGTVRDIGLIDSATVMPQQSFKGTYLHPTVASMAAACLFHLCANHGFVDGSKRAAAGAALVFLDANGYESAFTVDELEQITPDAAGGFLDTERLTRLFEAAVSKIA